MSWTSAADVERWFTYQAPSVVDVARLREIRMKARELAECILVNTPPCADQFAAIRKVREAVMTANAAIVCQRRPAAAEAEAGPNAYLGTTPVVPAPGHGPGLPQL